MSEDHSDDHPPCIFPSGTVRSRCAHRVGRECWFGHPCGPCVPECEGCTHIETSADGTEYCSYFVQPAAIWAMVSGCVDKKVKS